MDDPKRTFVKDERSNIDGSMIKTGLMIQIFIMTDIYWKRQNGKVTYRSVITKLEIILRSTSHFGNVVLNT